MSNQNQSIQAGLRQKPFAEACEQNKLPILKVLRVELSSCRNLLEIGSGTGQHAVYFARHLPYLHWHTSDLPGQHDGIRLWQQEAGLVNISGPYPLDVNQSDWPVPRMDAVFSANTAHIMSESSVLKMIESVARLLTAQGCFCLYGPFMYDGRHNSDSNARFDRFLKLRDPRSGVRDAVKLSHHAEAFGLKLQQDYPMPVNNRLLVWRKV